MTTSLHHIMGMFEDSTPRSDLAWKEMSLLSRPTAAVTREHHFLAVKKQSHIEEIVEMSRHGTSLFGEGDYRRASLLFQEAIALLNSVARSCTDSWHDTGFHQTDVESHLQTAATPSTIRSTVYRSEFDEGMEVYNVPAEPDQMDPMLVIRSKLLFNMGQARRNMLEFEGASSLYEEALKLVLPIAADSRVPCRPITVNRIVIPILHNIAQLYYRWGFLHKAIGIFRLALGHCRAIDGPQSASVALTLNCLGVLHYHLSSAEPCKPQRYLLAALAIQKEIFGFQSSAVATTLNNLGRVSVQHEEFDQALLFYEQALEVRRNVLGLDNLDYAATAFNAGQCLHLQGSHTRAILLYEEFLRVALLKFSENHRDVAIVLSGMAQIHQERRNFSEATDLYKRSLAVGRAALGDNHSEVAMLLNRIGNFHFECDDLSGALMAYQEGLRIEKSTLADNHPNVIVTLSNIGEIHRSQGAYRLAIQFYTEAAKLQRETYGMASAEVASTLNVIGLIHEQTGDSDMACRKLQEALLMRQSVLGDDHLDVAATVTYLGIIFCRKSMISAAMQLFNQSMKIRLKNLGRNHRDVGFTLYNLGLCHQLQGSYKESIECFEETLRIEKLVLGDYHRDVAMTMYKLGEVRLANGELSLALSCFNQVLDVESESGEKRDSLTIGRTLNEIGNVHHLLGEPEQMMAAYTQAARFFRQSGLSSDSVKVVPERIYAIARYCHPSAAAA